MPWNLENNSIRIVIFVELLVEITRYWSKPSEVSNVFILTFNLQNPNPSAEQHLFFDIYNSEIYWRLEILPMVRLNLKNNDMLIIFGKFFFPN